MKWEMVKIGDICEIIQTGKTPPTKQEKYFNGNINWYNPGDFTGGKYLNDSNRTITASAIKDKKATLFPKGTVLITCIGNIGKVGICKMESSSNQQITGLKPKEYIDSSYLYYWLRANQKILEHFANKAVVPILNGRNLKNIGFKYPNSLTEQKRIAQLLDTADALRQRDKALLEGYDELLESVFLEMFGDVENNPKKWIKSKFKELCLNEDSKRKPVKQSDRKNMQGNYPYYGATGIIDSVNSFLFDGEYLLIAEDGKALVNRNKPIAFRAHGQFWVNNHAHVLKSNGKANLIYLEHFFAHKNIRKFVTGIDQFKLNRSNLDRIDIICPPISLQNKFAQIVQNIEAQKEKVRKQLEESEDLFGALMQEVFG